MLGPDFGGLVARRCKDEEAMTLHGGRERKGDDDIDDRERKGETGARKTTRHWLPVATAGTIHYAND